MSEASMASQIASSVRSNATDTARQAREAVKPQNAGRTSEAASQFDVSGGIIHSSKSDKAHKTAESVVNLLA